jgi:shikimate dehydrogenase
VNPDATIPQLFVLLGDPVQHSLSPRMQNAAFAAAKLDAVYVALRTPAQMVGPLMREVAVAGGGGNVTLPHKGVAAQALDEASEAVHATGACNVFWWEEGKGLCGDNTDVEAFRIAAEAVTGSSLLGARVLLLGAGGAARAVVQACLAAGVSQLDVLNRSSERAVQLVNGFGRPSMLNTVDRSGVVGSDRYDLIVNATALGLREADPLPLEPEVLNTAAVLDLVYGLDETPFVRAARKLALESMDGRRMLVEQAARSYETWFGFEAPRRVMYASVGMQTA